MLSVYRLAAPCAAPDSERKVGTQVTVGNYWQSGFGNGDTEAIEYHHRWELGRAVSLRYGIGRSLRPYDGEREARNFATLTLLWRF